MKPLKPIAALLTSLLLATAAVALPPEIELDRLLLQAKSSLDAKEYSQATESLAKAEKLGIPLPETFYFHAGRASAGAGKYEQSLKMYERYLTMSGTKGKFYQEALTEMNTAEAAIKKRDAGKAADRAKYDEDMAEYRKKVEECPETFRDRVQSAFRRVASAERACERNDRQASCDYVERVSYGNITDRRIPALKSARSDLRELQQTSSSEWCEGRYSRPSMPASLR